jgi:hypothetical protein
MRTDSAIERIKLLSTTLNDFEYDLSHIGVPQDTGLVSYYNQLKKTFRDILIAEADFLSSLDEGEQ